MATTEVQVTPAAAVAAPAAQPAANQPEKKKIPCRGLVKQVPLLVYSYYTG